MIDDTKGDLIFGIWVLIEVILGTIGKWDVIIPTCLVVFIYYVIGSLLQIINPGPPGLQRRRGDGKP
jgi:hypothetical protein